MLQLFAGHRFIFAILFSCLVFTGGEAFCQERKFLGRVVDGDTQKPLKNVNIVVLGTTSGTVSNHLGFFEVTVDPAKYGTLVASHIGYATSEVPVPAEEKFKFSLTKVYQPLKDIILADHPKVYRPVEPAKAASGFGADGFGVVESGAVFPGGMDNFDAFVGNNLAREASEMKSKEIVVIFTVNASGKAVDFIFPDSTANTFNVHIAAALDAMPAWTPATQRQVSVPQGFILKVVKKRADLTVFTDFMTSNTSYPAEARRGGFEGPVLVAFSVDPAGVISDIKKMADVGGGCGEEVMRAVGTTPAKIAQELREATGQTNFLLPVFFGLQNNFKGPAPGSRPNIYTLQPVYITAVGIVRERKVTGYGAGYPIDWNRERTASGPSKITIKGMIPASLKTALNDKKGTVRLDLVDNGLEIFPTDILKLPNLKVLNLETNQISSLPEEIGSLTKMLELYLYQNNLKELPKGLAQLVNLQVLGLGSNQLTSIPDQVTSLKALKGLDLSDNRITTIPVEIKSLKDLNILLLSNNQINRVTDELFELQNLATLDISGNPMDSAEFSRVKNAMPNTNVITQVVVYLPLNSNSDEVFTVIEESAFPKDGMGGFYKFVADKMKYPPQARKMGIDGKVFVEFVVNKDGSISDVRVVKGIGGGCDEEAVRVVRMAPAWIPGKQKSKPVRQRMVLPITFKLG